MRTYTIEYYDIGEYEEVKTECVKASSKQEAYKAFMDAHDWKPYAAWVASVTYRNGRTKRFNTFCGKSL